MNEPTPVFDRVAAAHKELIETATLMGAMKAMKMLTDKIEAHVKETRDLEPDAVLRLIKETTEAF